MDSNRLAWAGGFFEAEGSLSHHLPKGRKTPRATLDLSQKGTDHTPQVLEAFRLVTGCGQIFGPYRGYLYYWRTHDVALIASVVVSLWPWLSPEKRTQMAKTLATVPALWLAVSFGELLERRVAPFADETRAEAWAAGFFEGDGTIGAYKVRRSSDAAVLTASVVQASDAGVPSSLTRFRDVVGVGSIRGPIQPRGWSKLPQYRWQTQGSGAERLAQVVLPWLAPPKRTQVLTALGAVR